MFHAVALSRVEAPHMLSGYQKVSHTPVIPHLKSTHKRIYKHMDIDNLYQNKLNYVLRLSGLETPEHPWELVVQKYLVKLTQLVCVVIVGKGSCV